MDISDLCYFYRCEPLHLRLRMIRTELNASQEQLAEWCGVAQSVISRLEAGRDAQLSTWIKILAGLGCELTIRATTVEDEDRDHHDRENLRRRERRQAGLAPNWVRGRRT